MTFGQRMIGLENHNRKESRDTDGSTIATVPGTVHALNQLIRGNKLTQLKTPITLLKKNFVNSKSGKGTEKSPTGETATS
ncbi:hypothetical protein JTB14_031367 [Gonioctena quinquepunctata]|nr:hypothetical protein JTB14_031367 [Gonioctena quinquepunctata]